MKESLLDFQRYSINLYKIHLNKGLFSVFIFIRIFLIYSVGIYLISFIIPFHNNFI